MALDNGRELGFLKVPSWLLAVDMVRRCAGVLLFVWADDRAGRDLGRGEGAAPRVFAIEAEVGRERVPKEACCRRFGMLDLGRGSLEGRGSPEGRVVVDVERDG